MCAVSRPQAKKLHLKKIASENVFKSNQGVHIRDFLTLVKGLNSQNSPMVEKSGSLSAAQENSVKLRLGSQAFVKILIHSKQCGSCDNLKCKKMKMIHDHFNKCSRNDQNCPVCGQFIALVRPFVK